MSLESRLLRLEETAATTSEPLVDVFGRIQAFLDWFHGRGSFPEPIGPSSPRTPDEARVRALEALRLMRQRQHA